MPWPDGNWYDLLEQTLVAWTFEVSEPWIEVWRDVNNYGVYRICNRTTVTPKRSESLLMQVGKLALWQLRRKIHLIAPWRGRIIKHHAVSHTSRIFEISSRRRSDMRVHLGASIRQSPALQLHMSICCPIPA